VKHLAGHGSAEGRHESAYGVMKKLMSNKLAAGYNFCGRHKKDVEVPKKAFKKSPLYPVVVGKYH